MWTLSSCVLRMKTFILRICFLFYAITLRKLATNHVRLPQHTCVFAY